MRKTKPTHQNEIPDFNSRLASFSYLVNNIIETNNDSMIEKSKNKSEKNSKKKNNENYEIRCICSNNNPDTKKKLIKCPDCQYYLHEDCFIESDLKDFTCPFCRLQIDGVDQFSLLKNYMGSVANEVQEISLVLDIASSIERNSSMPDNVKKQKINELFKEIKERLQKFSAFYPNK